MPGFSTALNNPLRMVSHSRPHSLCLCVALLPGWHCEEEVLGKHTASSLPGVRWFDTIITLTGTGKSASTVSAVHTPVPALPQPHRCVPPV